MPLVDKIQFNFTEMQREVIDCIRSDIKYNPIKVYLVGGAVRDTIMGVKPNDVDLFVNLNAYTMVDAFRKRSIPLLNDATATSKGILRVIDPNGPVIDIASNTGSGWWESPGHSFVPTGPIEANLGLRDLTINAIAAEIGVVGDSLNIIDPYGGVADIQSKTIKFVGDPGQRITEDYLRLLRAARFATKCGPTAKMDSRSEEAARAQAQQIKRVSKERIRQEILKALQYPNAGWMFRWMDSLGLLREVMPDHFRGKGCTQNEYHTDDVLEHLCYCVDQCVGEKYTPELKLATFFHDVAKPHTKKKEGNTYTFHDHEIVGATIAYNWMKEYRFSRAEISKVVKLVRHHQWRFYKDTSPKTYRKWLQKVGREGWRELMRLRIADRKGNRSKADRPGVTREMKDTIRVIRGILKSGDPIFMEDLAISGNDLKALGIPPSPQYKVILTNLLGMVVSNPEYNTRKWLLDYCNNHYVVKTKAEKDVGTN